MKVRAFSLLAALALISSPAAAADYLFSYEFNTGEKITGSFTGTASGALVSIDSSITMKLNGVAFVGPLSAFGSTAVAGDGTQCGSPSCFTAPAVMSADPSKNNFLIADFANAVPFGTNYFYIFPWRGGTLGLGLQANFQGNLYNYVNQQYVPANWSLVEANSAAPEPATWAMMVMSFGVVGGAMRRQRKLTAVAA